MAKDYMTLLAENHPGIEANCEGDRAVYNNISFASTVIVKTTLDGEYLAYKKQSRYNQIDYKTRNLIASGFIYDGKTFSLSISAQINWNALQNQTIEFTWPVEISTIDNNKYSLIQANIKAFWVAGKDLVKGHLDSGRNLKVSIIAAIDEIAVDAIIDNR